MGYGHKLLVPPITVVITSSHPLHLIYGLNKPFFYVLVSGDTTDRWEVLGTKMFKNTEFYAII